ncbi:FAD-dependent monooxygenase [Glycomyces terrestris]|uniref:3-hydroxybenzoate 6-monooxygenase n=1 Tax=Glycomyces terrestris TaxID=2493553 RepID=A0A426V2U1_9ACTN|nr:FAD-dependent monooxygenase [Glycomyces terrestris]RRS01229.1 3-hydroxybenzoate 6-monooxygenase [Glycomyces terrestris]
MTGLPVLVAGGGIGGLAAAVSLARKGIPSLVLERNAAFDEIGAGIQLGPNALAVLDAIGAGARVRERLIPVGHLEIRDALDGRALVRLDLRGAFRERYRAGYGVIHRGDLLRALHESCLESPLVALAVNAEAVDWEERPDRVEVRTADGRRLQGRCVIAADGLHSRFRQAIAGDGEPVPSGHATYRCLIPADRMPAASRVDGAVLWAGPDCHLVHYPLKDRAVYNAVVTVNDGSADTARGEAVPDEEVRARFDRIGAGAAAFLSAGTGWRRWTLRDREPVATWTKGRAALLGDAAHPMLQYAAQGACMAIEDAAALAGHLAAQEDPQAALDGYAAARRERTARVQRLSRWMAAEVYHPAGTAAKRRDAMLLGLSEERLLDHLAWLYTPFGGIA